MTIVVPECYGFGDPMIGINAHPRCTSRKCSQCYKRNAFAFHYKNGYAVTVTEPNAVNMLPLFLEKESTMRYRGNDRISRRLIFILTTSLENVF